jgi:hypothetical protein
MKFVLAGFRQNANIRRYAFQGIGDDRRTRTEFSVAVDLTLLQKHRIPLQEAPLLCCLSLASRAEDEQLSNLLPSERNFVFSEEEILAHVGQITQKRADTQADRKPKPYAPSKVPLSPSPVLIDSQTGRSSIGLGSRTGLPLTS